MRENKEAKGEAGKGDLKGQKTDPTGRAYEGGQGSRERRRKARKTEVERKSSSRRVHEKIKAGECNVKGVNSETRKKCHAVHFTGGGWKVK